MEVEDIIFVNKEYSVSPSFLPLHQVVVLKMHRPRSQGSKSPSKPPVSTHVFVVDPETGVLE